jgi:sulfate adenylyltransferase
MAERSAGVLPPHGGQGLVNRFIPDPERKLFDIEASGYKSLTISDGDLSVFYRIADGALSPLEGPMDSREFYKVLKDEVIERGGKKYSWTIPLALSAARKECEKFNIGEKIAIKDKEGVTVGVLHISDIYPFDKGSYNKTVYGTDRADHPGPRIVNDDPRDYLLGGKIFAVPYFKDPQYSRHMLSPIQSRLLFEKLKWERIVAFQTRNPLHRAHEYAIVYAVEQLTKEGYFTGAVLNPLVGQTKSDDVPAEIRMRTYEVLIDNKILGYGDTDEDFWRSKKYSLADQLLLIGLDIKMFYAGPKEAVMHAIYRQNYGFTDIIIGRKHADAPFDDGAPAWGDFEAQDKFNSLKGELSIKPFKIGYAAYFDELGKVGLVEENRGKGFKEFSVSGKELRKKLEAREPIDERVMRRPVAEILYDAYRHNISALRTDIKSKNITWHDSSVSKSDREKKNGHRGVCLWLTGLSCSGKSTIAVELQKMLFSAGSQVFILDGDNIRHGLNKNLGFSSEDRSENIRRIGEVAKLFTEAGFIVITAFISPYKKDRDLARSIFPNGDFVEVFVDASISVCETRDTKGLYKKARAGEIKEFTGISAPYEKPEHPELIIETGRVTKENSAEKIMGYLIKNGYVAPKAMVVRRESPK